MLKLHKKDKKILSVLDFNARASLVEISKKTGYSKQLIRYRINELSKKGIIGGTYAVIDNFKVGYGSYHIFFKFQNISEKKENEIISYLNSLKQCKQVFSIGGSWDLIFVLWTRDLIELNNLLNKVSIKYGNFIINKFISISTMFSYFRYKCIYDSKNYPEISFNLVEPFDKLDNIDYTLMDMLNKDARLSNIELAKKLKINPSTVQKRIKNLISKEVIKGFRIYLNEQVLGYSQYRLHVKLKSLDVDKINKLKNHLRYHKNALSVRKSMDKTYLEINLLVKDPRSFHNIVKEIKHSFSDVARDYNWYILYDVTKK
jgi:Lrp/AsnC family leucine-responsive transcriptional regulator